MGLFDSGGDNGLSGVLNSLKQNKQLYGNIETPQFGNFTPQLFDNESANYQLTSDDPVAKSKQLEAIARLGSLGNTGMSDADVAGFHQAQEMGDQMARAKTQAALADAQSRGVAGGGLEFAMREQGNQDAAQRAQDAALQQAAQASNNRNQYLQAYAGQLGQARQQDYQTNANNSNIVNQFNAMNTQGRNAANQANTAAKNSAFQYNQGMQQQNYQNQLTKADRLSGINTQEGNAYAAQDEANRRKSAALGGLVGAGIGAFAGGPAGASVGYGIGSNI